jgi:hypothetical protein
MTRASTRRHITACALFGIGGLGFGIWDWHTEAQPASPRLLVILVVDQFRADYIELFKTRWRGGVRVLLDEGAWFTRAEFPYLNTATCAGHVTIATGALPRTHGIVLNRWWHRREARVYNCTDDEASPHVSYGASAPPFGSSARQVLIPTLADRLRAEQPGARAVSLSLKPRSAISLAGHGEQIVTWFDEGTRTFVTSRAFSAAPVDSVRRFIARDPPEADLGKVWTLQDTGDSYREPDLGIGERPKAGWTSLFPHPLEGATGADAQFFDRWQKSPLSDAYLARMAMALVDDLQLGQRQSTDYLAIGFSALDLLGHDFGPESREVEDLLMRLDGTLGELLHRLDERVGRDNYVVALSADHGTAPTPERVGGGHIASEDVQQLVEQTLIGLWGPHPSARYVAWVGSGSIYFAQGVYDRIRQDPRALERVTQALMDVPGMLRVIRSAEISPTSGDANVRAAAAGYHQERTADLLLVPKRHWVIDLRAENEATTHGTFHDYDRRVPILLRGHRIRPGRYGRLVSPADVAPTFALLAGVTLPDADGRPLRDAIR